MNAGVAAMNAALQAVRANYRANGVWKDKGAKKLYDECHEPAARVTAYTN